MKKQRHKKLKEVVPRLLELLISLVLTSFLFNILIIKTNITMGGVNGIAVILNKIYHIEPSISIFCMSLGLLIFSFIFLGVERSSGTILATFLYPLLVKITSIITKDISINIDDFLLISIYIGIISGIANGIMYKSGYSNGGLPIISQIIYKKWRIPLSKSSFLINGLIVIFCGFIFSWTNVLYAFIILYINSYMIDKIVSGVSKKKAFYIITKESKKVEEYIVNILGHTVTIFEATSGYKEEQKKLLFTVIPVRDYNILKKEIKKIDSNSFFMISSLYQSNGGR